MFVLCVSSASGRTRFRPDAVVLSLGAKIENFERPQARRIFKIFHWCPPQRDEWGTDFKVLAREEPLSSSLRKIKSMIQLLSKLKVADNSGARLVQCIKVLKSRAKTASVGDLITVTVKKARPHKQVQKKDVRIAVVVRTKATYVRSNGIKVSLGENSCVILNSRSNKTPVGTRILGPIPVRELRKSKIIKCILLAKSVI